MEKSKSPPCLSKKRRDKDGPPSVSASFSGPLLFHCGQGLGDFLYIRDDWDVVVFVPGQVAVAVDDGDGASGDAFVFEIDAVLGCDCAAGLEIGQQRVLN